MSKSKFVLAGAISLCLSACGGGSNSTPENMDGGAAGAENNGMPGEGSDQNVQWKKVGDEYGYDLGIYEKDGVVYTATHSTRDGTNFIDYNTPDLDFGAEFRLLSYIDESNKYYLFQALTRPSVTGNDRWAFYDWATFGDMRYMAGTSDHLVSVSFQANAESLSQNLRDPVEYTNGDPFNWIPIELPGGENIFTNGISKPAENGTGTILLTDVFEGGWISNDGGRTWSTTLDDLGYLDLTVGSDDYPNDLYAFNRNSGKYSSDGGVSWLEISVPNYAADRWLAGTVDSSNGDIILWGINPRTGDYLFKSSDHGATWESVGDQIDPSACELCAVPDVAANEYGYFVSADELFFLPKQ